MQTIQVVVEDALLRETNRAVKRYGVNRSALIRRALQEHLKRLETLEQERRDRDGYRRVPQSRAEVAAWAKVAFALGCES